MNRLYVPMPGSPIDKEHERRMRGEEPNLFGQATKETTKTVEKEEPIVEKTNQKIEPVIDRSEEKEVPFVEKMVQGREKLYGNAILKFDEEHEYLLQLQEELRNYHELPYMNHITMSMVKIKAKILRANTGDREYIDNYIDILGYLRVSVFDTFTTRYLSLFIDLQDLRDRGIVYTDWTGLKLKDLVDGFNEATNTFLTHNEKATRCQSHMHFIANYTYMVCLWLFHIVDYMKLNAIHDRDVKLKDKLHEEVNNLIDELNPKQRIF